jgi:signal transduction histidine kinase
VKPEHTLARRIALIWIVAALPLLAGTIFYIVFYANREIAFTRAELSGVELLRPVDPLIGLLHEHQVLSAAAADHAVGAAARLDGNTASIKEQLSQLDAAVHAFNAMPATRMSARPASRRPLDLSQLREELGQPSGFTGGSLPIERVREAIRKIGNSSNLILDTDLDSFSLVDLVVVVLPRAQDRLAKIEDIARENTRTDASRALEFAISAAQIEESDISRTTYDVRTAIDENNAFRTPSPSLQSALPASLQGYSDSQEHLALMLKQDRPRATTGDLDAAFARARASTTLLWNTGAAELEKLLVERLIIYETYRFWGFVFIALSFLSSTGVTAYAGRSIAARIRAERAAHQEMIKLNAELEQRVAERTRLLTATVAELEAFSYSVSHDLRNPLRAVDGFSLVLLEDYAETLDETARDYLARIRKGTQRMGMLIDDLLKLSRLSRVEMEFSALNLSDMANEIVAQLREREPERNVVFDCQQGLTAVGDASLVQDVLVNLLENAWKYTRRQPEARIEFFLQPKADPTGPDTFVVRDNGAGFDMRYADKLFTAFQRLHSTSDFEGTGIGLATVRRILVRHGGQIRAESEVGKGSAFSFSLAAESKK